MTPDERAILAQLPLELPFTSAHTQRIAVAHGLKRRGWVTIETIEGKAAGDPAFVRILLTGAGAAAYLRGNGR